MSQLHRNTPTLQVFDPLGQPVRTVAYYQHPDLKHAMDTPTRITASKALRGGRISQRWDPRLFTESEKDRTVTPNFIDQYSLSGRPLLSESVDAGWRLTLWNATGQPFLSWDGRNTRTQHIYDTLQRPRAVLERSATETKDTERCISRIRYRDRARNSGVTARNQCGQPIQVNDSAGSLRFNDYSLRGALLSETRQFLQELDEPDWSHGVPLEVGQGATTFWRYNALGELLSQTDAAGNTQSSDYDVAGRLRTSALQLAGKQPQVLVSAIRYNAFGQIETETTGNGVVNESTYCPQTGRLLRLSAKRAGEKACLQDLNYAYDPVGNILSIEDKSRPVQHCANQCIEPLRTFAYDSLDQLVVASGWEVRKPNRGPALPAYQGPCLDASQLTNYTEFYRYDAAGNLQALRHVSPHPYTRNLITAKGSNRSLLAFKTEVTEAILASAFDANGNLEKLLPGGQTLQWDSRNQLRQVSPVLRGNGLHDTEDYIYDHTGKRVRKASRRQANGAELIAEVRYLPGLEIRTNSATGEVLHVISAPAGRSSARVLDWKRSPPGDLQNQQLRYSLDDHLGSSTLELDDQAQVLSQEGYYPYGGTAWWAASNQTEAKYKTIRYSGKERDATGLYYYGLRYYAPWLGRWINPDPAGTVDGMNLFKMVRNNPVMYLDENGLDSKKGYIYLPFAEESIFKMTIGINLGRALSGKEPYEIIAANKSALNRSKTHLQSFINKTLLIPGKKNDPKWNKALDLLKKTTYRAESLLDDLSNLDGEQAKIYILGHGAAGISYIASGKEKVFKSGKMVTEDQKLDVMDLAKNLADKKLPSNFKDFRLNACEGADAISLTSFDKTPLSGSRKSLGQHFAQALGLLNHFADGFRVTAYHGKGLISDQILNEKRFDHQKRILKHENLLTGPVRRSKEVREFFKYTA